MHILTTAVLAAVVAAGWCEAQDRIKPTPQAFRPSFTSSSSFPSTGRPSDEPDNTIFNDQNPFRPGSSGGRPGSIGGRPGSFGGRPGSSGGRPGSIGGRPGSSAGRPTVFGDPSTSSFGTPAPTTFGNQGGVLGQPVLLTPGNVFVGQPNAFPAQAGFGQGGFGQSGFGQGGLSQGGFSQGGFGQGSFGQGSLGQGSFGQGSLGQSGFGQSGFGQGGLSQGSFGQGSFGQGGLSQGSFGQGSFGQGSFGQGSFGQGGFGQGGFGQSGVRQSGFGQGGLSQGGFGQGSFGQVGFRQPTTFTSQGVFRQPTTFTNQGTFGGQGGFGTPVTIGTALPRQDGTTFNTGLGSSRFPSSGQFGQVNPNTFGGGTPVIVGFTQDGIPVQGILQGPVGIPQTFTGGFAQSGLPINSFGQAGVPSGFNQIPVNRLPGSPNVPTVFPPSPVSPSFDTQSGGIFGTKTSDDRRRPSNSSTGSSLTPRFPIPGSRRFGGKSGTSSNPSTSASSASTTSTKTDKN